VFIADLCGFRHVHSLMESDAESAVSSIVCF